MPKPYYCGGPKTVIHTEPWAHCTVTHTEPWAHCTVLHLFHNAATRPTQRRRYEEAQDASVPIIMIAFLIEAIENISC